MDISQFLPSLLHSLSGLEFVVKVDFQTEAFVLKGRATLQKSRFLHVYFNEITGTTAFALIEQDKRLWGTDFDNIRGWHAHPVDAPDSHFDIEPKTVEEIIEELKNAWLFLP